MVRGSGRYPSGLCAAALGGACVLLLAGCRKPGSKPAEEQLRIVFTGEVLGELEPCRCAGEEAGGLPRLGSYVAGLKGPFVLLDVGCVGRGGRDFEQLRAQAVLRAFKKLTYRAVNVGETELYAGAEGIAHLAECGVPLVSANVKVKGSGSSLSPYLLLEVGKHRVAVTGAVEASGGFVGPGLVVEPPLEALTSLLEKLRGRADAFLVLCDLSLDSVRQLTQTCPEVTVALVRGRGNALQAQLWNRTVVAAVSGEARYAGDLTVDLSRSGAGRVRRFEAVLLDGRFPPDRAVTEASCGWYKRQIEGRVFAVQQGVPGWERIRRVDPEPGNAFVGSKKCAPCHAELYRAWKETRHARAFETLRKLHYHWSPECIVCHVVGFGARSGFRSADATPHLAEVGCESCHGPGKAVVGGRCRELLRPVSDATCRRCHTPRRDPSFVYEQKRKGVHTHKAGPLGGTAQGGTP